MQEATDLADMFQRVDSVFASGNLQRVATMLATMRRGLVLVGNIPEFEGGEVRLQVGNKFSVIFLQCDRRHDSTLACHLISKTPSRNMSVWE